VRASHQLVLLLRGFLAVAFGVLVVSQVLVLPLLFSSWDDVGLRWPLLLVSELGLVCVEVVVAATWRLLTMVEEDRIFSEDAFTWVDTILGAMATAWALLLGALVCVVGRWEQPGLPVALLLMLVGGAVLGLLVVVMRELLRQATALRTEFEAVI
jgi:hypothetical protein